VGTGEARVLLGPDRFLDVLRFHNTEVGATKLIATQKTAWKSWGIKGAFGSGLRVEPQKSKGPNVRGPREIGIEKKGIRTSLELR